MDEAGAFFLSALPSLECGIYPEIASWSQNGCYPSDLISTFEAGWVGVAGRRKKRRRMWRRRWWEGKKKEVDPIPMKIYKRKMYRDRKQISGCQGLGGGGLET